VVIVLNAKDADTGRIVITLDEYQKAHNISKNKIVLGAGVQRTQLQRYCQNNVARVDLGVLARICRFLNCDLSDIMRYDPGGNGK